jgi:hypothetical protein
MDGGGRRKIAVLHPHAASALLQQTALEVRTALGVIKSFLPMMDARYERLSNTSAALAAGRLSLVAGGDSSNCAAQQRQSCCDQRTLPAFYVKRHRDVVIHYQ